MKHTPGFTLIESLLVLAIVGIIGLFAVPNLASHFTKAQSQVMQGELLHLLHQAHVESQHRHVAVGLCQSDGHDNCQSSWRGQLLLFEATTEDGGAVDEAQVIRRIDFSGYRGQLHWRSYPHYRDYLLFSPDGLTENDNGTFWYCEPRALQPAFAITLNKVGMTQVMLPDKQGRVNDGEGRVLDC